MTRRFRRPSTPSPNHELIDPVLVEIFSGEKNYLDNQLVQITTENQALGGTMNAFRFEGELFTIVNLRDIRGIDVAPLHPNLEKTFRRYKKRSDQLTVDMKKIRNALSMVISKCRHHQDVHDVLPDVISNKIPAFQGLERIREEGFVLKDKPMLLKQFREVMDIALQYQANRLIFQ